ncbi:MAG TPA: TadE family protein [Stellaceae bacterium]|nr:TadE family protein [Stellaceae bacterium]
MRPSSLRALCRAHSGNAAIEFALVFPMFLMLIFGTFDYGRLLWTWQALQETATVGARCMAIPQGACASGGSYNQANTTSFIQAVAQHWGLSIPSGNITLSQNASCGGSGGFSTVSITTIFTSVVPKIVLLPGSGKSLSATACYPNSP